MIIRILIFLLLIATLITSSANKATLNISRYGFRTHNLYLLNRGDYLHSGSLKQLNISKEGSLLYNKSLRSDLRLDIVNDVAVYGSKVYLIGSDAIDVLSSKTGRLIKRIFFAGEHIMFYRDEAFISGSFGTIAVLDTVGLYIKKRINTGSRDDPTGLTVANGKLYVAIPGLPYGTDMVSIIDLNTLQLIKTIDFMQGPMSIKSDAGDIVILLSSSETSVDPFLQPGGISVINSKTDSVIFISQAHPLTTDDSELPAALYGNRLYYFDRAGRLICYDLISRLPMYFISNRVSFSHPSCITVDSLTGEIFTADVKNGDEKGLLYAFDKNGKSKFVTNTEINPTQIVITNK